MLEKLQKELKEFDLNLQEELEILKGAINDVGERLHILEEKQKRDKQNERTA